MYEEKIDPRFLYRVCILLIVLEGIVLLAYFVAGIFMQLAFFTAVIFLTLLVLLPILNGTRFKILKDGINISCVAYDRFLHFKDIKKVGCGLSWQPPDKKKHKLHKIIKYLTPEKCGVVLNNNIVYYFPVRNSEKFFGELAKEYEKYLKSKK